MKSSKKVFTALTVVLPLMLAVSMAKAEDGSSAGASNYAGQERMKAEMYCKEHGGRIEKDEGDKMKCVIIPTLLPKGETPRTEPVKTSTEVSCKRSVMGDAYVFSCDDGVQVRAPMNKPAPMDKQGPCSEIGKMIRELKEKMDESLLKQYREKLANCIRSQETTKPPFLEVRPAVEGNSCARLNAEMENIRAKLGTTEDGKAYLVKLEAKLATCSTDSTYGDATTNLNTEASTGNATVTATSRTKIVVPMNGQRRIKDGEKCTVLITKSGRKIANTRTCTQ